MLRVFFIFAAIGVSLFLASCNTLSKKECLAGDWKGIGFTDGYNGYAPQKRLEKHIKSCERVKVVPNFALWKKGYKAGLLRYCTPEGGLREGQHGFGYYGACPPETEPGFLRGNELGYRQYSLQSKLKSLKSDYESKEDELEYLSEKLKTAPETEKSGLRSQIYELERDLSQIHDDQRRVESDLYLVEWEVVRFSSDP